MTEDGRIGTQPERVRVTTRTGSYPGLRLGATLAYEIALPIEVEVRPQAPRRQRIYVLLDYGVQLNQPSVFPTEQSTSWYVDIVDLQEDAHEISIRDLFIDLIVPADGLPFRILDLDEFADALATGTLSADKAADALRRLQRFTDDFLVGEWPMQCWADFPPARLQTLASATLDVPG